MLWCTSYSTLPPKAKGHSRSVAASQPCTVVSNGHAKRPDHPALRRQRIHADRTAWRGYKRVTCEAHVVVAAFLVGLAFLVPALQLQALDGLGAVGGDVQMRLTFAVLQQRLHGSHAVPHRRVG
jgi:hypothetical protein